MIRRLPFFSPRYNCNPDLLCNPDKRIEFFLPADGGLGTMTAVNSCIVIQLEKFLLHAGDQGIVIPSGKIGSTDGTGKQGIAYKNMTIRIKRNTSRRMAGGVDHFE